MSSIGGTANEQTYDEVNQGLMTYQGSRIGARVNQGFTTFSVDSENYVNLSYAAMRKIPLNSLNSVNFNEEARTIFIASLCFAKASVLLKSQINQICHFTR